MKTTEMMMMMMIRLERQTNEEREGRGSLTLLTPTVQEVLLGS